MRKPQKKYMAVISPLISLTRNILEDGNELGRTVYVGCLRTQILIPIFCNSESIEGNRLP